MNKRVFYKMKKLKSMNKISIMGNKKRSKFKSRKDKYTNLQQLKMKSKNFLMLKSKKPTLNLSKIK